MTIKTMNTYVMVTMATVSMGLSAVDYNTYKAFVFQALKNLMMPSFSMETRAVDRTEKTSILKDVPNIDLFGCSIKPETRMISKKSAPTIVVFERPHNSF